MTTIFNTMVQPISERLIIRLPDDASAELPSRGQVAADVRLNGHAFAMVIEPDGRKGHWLALNDVADAGGLHAGDAVDVEIAPTTVWPEPDLPEDFASALAAASDIHEVWGDITPMARWEWVRWINATGSQQTRGRRVEASVDKLRSGHRRPCCFDLSSCTDPELARSGKLIEAHPA